MISGYLRMMSHSGLDPVQYFFEVVNYSEIKKNKASGEIESRISLNELIGKKIRLQFSGEIRCVDCGTITKKSFNQGSCYKCFLALASNDMCILKPETCHFHLGTCREPEWGKKNCFKKHIVYLANSSGLKVGITKENPYSNRWVDQGAMSGIAMIEVESRRDAGIIECEFGKYVTDKTSWQKMISTDPEKLDMESKKKEFLEKVKLNGIVENYKVLKNEKPVEIQYPIQKYPSKKVSLKPDPQKPIEDILLGIKGQYLLFANGAMNLRSNSGYFVSLD